MRVKIFECSVHLVNGDVSQIWPERHVFPDDIFCKESSRAAAGGHKPSQGASRVPVSMLM